MCTFHRCWWKESVGISWFSRSKWSSNFLCSNSISFSRDQLPVLHTSFLFVFFCFFLSNVQVKRTTLVPTSCHGINGYSQFPQNILSLVQFSSSVVSDSLRPRESQHARPPCPSPTPGVYSNLSVESVMPSNHLILHHPLVLLPSIFPSIRVFSKMSALHIRWPK